MSIGLLARLFDTAAPANSTQRSEEQSRVHVTCSIHVSEQKWMRFMSTTPFGPSIISERSMRSASTDTSPFLFADRVEVDRVDQHAAHAPAI